MSVQTGPVPVRRRIDPGRHDDMTSPTGGTTAMPRQSRQSAGDASEARSFRPAWLVVLVPAYQPYAPTPMASTRPPTSPRWPTGSARPAI